MRGGTDSRYEQFETSPETIEDELRLAVCKQRQTDRFKENYSIDGHECLSDDTKTCETPQLQTLK